MPARVLFTGGGGAGNEALWRLLGDRYDVHFGDADASAIDPSIPIERRHALPWASDRGFLDGMAKLCRELRVDVLIPGVDEELAVLARAAHTLAPTQVMLPEAGYIDTMTDKLEMISALRARNISVPRSQRLDESLDGFTFPCIAKPRRGRGSRGFRELEDRRSALRLREELQQAASTMILQERLDGTEYTVQMAADAGARLRAVVPVKVELKRGITLRAETERAPAVEQVCRDIHHALPARGCYNIQLMLTTDGRCLPFEINPRVSTTFCLVIAAGVDPIAVFRGDGRQQMSFTSGVTLRRHWSNHFATTEAS